MARKPGVYERGQLRTLQRRVKQWRAQEGGPKNVFFAQDHRPCEAMQTDFTVCDELAVTIGGVPFPHMLCHPVLPYSNWEWASICHSESLSAMKVGVQEALQHLGGIPTWHQTDHSTAATHQVSPGSRGFNLKYVVWMKHVGMKPRTIEVGEKEQNGDVEALNGALKRGPQPVDHDALAHMMNAFRERGYESEDVRAEPHSLAAKFTRITAHQQLDGVELLEAEVGPGLPHIRVAAHLDEVVEELHDGSGDADVALQRPPCDRRRHATWFVPTPFATPKWLPFPEDHPAGAESEPSIVNDRVQDAE